MAESGKRIAVFLPSLFGGGAERSMVRLANALTEQGYETDVVLPKVRGPLKAALNPNVRLVDLGALRLITSVPALVRYLRRYRPAALISAMNAPNLIAAWASRISRTESRLIVSVRNTFSEEVRLGGVKIHVTRRLIRRAYRHADAIVAVSRGVADDFSETMGIERERIDVIYNPVVSDELSVKSNMPIEHAWFSPKEPPVILAVGRLVPQKDFPTLLRAFADLRRRRNARLVILGEGPERTALEGLAKSLGISGDLDLPGFVDNPYPFMKRAQMFVLSSRFEGLPGVLIEAAALGVPLVSTDCPSGPREILEDGKWGKLVPVGDVRAMAAAMLEALDNPGPDPSPRGAEFSVARATARYLDVAFR